MDPWVLPLSRLLNAYLVWAGQQIPATEEGEQKWKDFLAYVDRPPPGAPPHR